MHLSDRLIIARAFLRKTMTGPPFLAFLPALVLAAYWLGGEGWLIMLALALPLVFAGLGVFDMRRDARPASTPQLLPSLDAALQEASRNSRRTACLMVQVDDADLLRDRFGAAVMQRLYGRAHARLRDTLREADVVVTMAPGRFAVILSPMRQLDLEAAIQLAGRLQARLEDPIAIDGQSTYMTCSIGFVLDSQLRAATARSFAAACETALNAAMANGPSAIRAYAQDMEDQPRTPALNADATAEALETGQIVPWFQPQICTDTGHVTGMEALARWQHPTRGLIPPGEFLPIMERAHQLERLSEIMLHKSLATLRLWDATGLDIPRMGVNFAGEELRNPRLVDKIRWELDRLDLTPDRLCVEVLETVIATSPDDMVARNINGLAKLGCGIDLDDFGTGHASISSIRRFNVSRLKIDRSFVIKVDRDPEQQRMIMAILTMAERLNLEVLAEGVETAGEHAMLAQLGCRHVQGFGIARPMPAEDVAEWLTRHRARLTAPPRIGRAARG